MSIVRLVSLFLISTVTTSVTTSCGLFKSKDSSPIENPTCTQPNVRSITRPVIPTDAKSGTFSYRFQVDLPKNPEDPLLVYVPGGPGQAGFSSPGAKARYPENFGVMRTDPRGVACNYAGDDQPQEFYNSEFVADDILAAVKSLGVKKYIIYGISYGTVVATIAGSKAEAAGLDTPKAVVLEGVVSERMTSTEDLYAKHWDELMTKRSTAFREKFKSGNYPMKLTKREWEQNIQTLLMVGVIQSKSGENVNLLDKILAFADNPTEAERSRIKEWMSVFSGGDGGGEDEKVPGANRFYFEIACAEVWKKVNSLRLDGDQFGYGGSNLCDRFTDKGYVFANRPFDAESWKIKAPLYYFQGKKDPATPYAQSMRHPDKQPNASTKSFMAVERGGHNPFEAQLRSCSDSVWKAIAVGPAEFKKELQNCTTPGLALAEYEGAKQTNIATLIPDSDAKYAAWEAAGVSNSDEIDLDVLRSIKKNLDFSPAAMTPK